MAERLTINLKAEPEARHRNSPRCQTTAEQYFIIPIKLCTLHRTKYIYIYYVCTYYDFIMIDRGFELVKRCAAAAAAGCGRITIAATIPSLLTTYNVPEQHVLYARCLRQGSVSDTMSIGRCRRLGYSQLSPTVDKTTHKTRATRCPDKRHKAKESN